MVAVHISKHSLFRLKITVGCRLCAYPSIHFSLDEDTLKITVGCRLCCERVCTLGVVACVYLHVALCVHVVLCVVLCCCVVVLWCCGCVVVWYVARLGARKKLTVFMSSSPPCVHSKCLRVYWQDARMLNTSGRFAGAHEGILKLHTEACGR